MFKIFREIAAVGIKDWYWFVVGLGRNEHHSCLNLYRFDGKRGALDKMDRRKQAHRIALALRDIQ